MTTHDHDLNEDAAAFEHDKAAASPLEIRPAAEPADVEQIADQVIAQFPRILAKLAE